MKWMASSFSFCYIVMVVVANLKIFVLQGTSDNVVNLTYLILSNTVVLFSADWSFICSNVKSWFSRSILALKHNTLDHTSLRTTHVTHFPLSSASKRDISFLCLNSASYSIVATNMQLQAMSNYMYMYIHFLIASCFLTESSCFLRVSSCIRRYTTTYGNGNVRL